MEQKTKTIPPGFIALAEKYGLNASGGVGFARRAAISELTGLSTNRLKDWMRIGNQATGTNLNFTRLEVVLRVLGHMPAPADDHERLKQAFVLGVVCEKDVEKVLGISPPSTVVSRAISGIRDLSDANLKKVRPFLTRIAADVLAAETLWRRELLGVGFELGPEAKSPTAAGAPSEEPRPAESGENRRPMISTPTDVMVEAAAPLILALLPILSALVERGSDDDFRRLRQLTATSGASHGVFELKGLLGPLCSAKAREISTPRKQ